MLLFSGKKGNNKTPLSQTINVVSSTLVKSFGVRFVWKFVTVCYKLDIHGNFWKMWKARFVTLLEVHWDYEFLNLKYLTNVGKLETIFPWIYIGRKITANWILSAIKIYDQSYKTFKNFKDKILEFFELYELFERTLSRLYLPSLVTSSSHT